MAGTRRPISPTASPRRRTAIEEADRDGRPVSFVATAEPRAENLAAETADAAKRRLAAIVPRPYLPNRRALADRLTEAFAPGSVEAVWVAGALDDGDGAAFASALSERRRERNDPAIGAAADRDAAAGEPRRRRLRPDQPFRRRRQRAEVAGFDQEGRRILEGTAPTSTRTETASPRSRFRPRSGTRWSASRVTGEFERRRRAASRRPLAAEGRRARSPAKARARRSRCLSR